MFMCISVCVCVCGVCVCVCVCVGGVCVCVWCVCVWCACVCVCGACVWCGVCVCVCVCVACVFLLNLTKLGNHFYSHERQQNFMDKPPLSQRRHINPRQCSIHTGSCLLCTSLFYSSFNLLRPPILRGELFRNTHQSSSVSTTVNFLGSQLIDIFDLLAASFGRC
jgi:hypothetical protein